MFEIIGVIVLTLVPLAFTGWYVTMLFMQWGWAGFGTLSVGDWAILIALGVANVGVWMLWWSFVGSAVDISVAVS